jgi:hypothetical protein
MDCDEPYLMSNEKTQPIQWTEQPTGALVAAGSLWPHMGFSVCHSQAQFQSIGFHAVKAFTGADQVNNWPL